MAVESCQCSHEDVVAYASAEVCSGMQITSAKSVTLRSNTFLNNFCSPYTYLDQVWALALPLCTNQLPSKPACKMLRAGLPFSGVIITGVSAPAAAALL